MPTKKKSEQETETVNAAEIHRVRAADFRSRYANSARLQASIYDFTLTFGQISNDREKLECEEYAEIVMSPQHAKVLLQILQRNVAGYEEKFGELQIPEGMS
ncbi:MAG: DUF3467 domain-containing protein [Thermoanaerobaculia bacterium]